MIAIGDRVREERERAGMTRYGLAQEARVAPETLRLIEANVSRPKPITVRRLADALGIEPDALIGPPSGVDDDERQVLAAWRQLPDGARRAVQRLMDDLVAV